MPQPSSRTPDSNTDLLGRPLGELRVLDLTRALAGPFCTMILGDLGADVIKVEPTGAGDMIRNWGPFDRGTSAYYLSGNRNKRGICVNFRHAEASTLLRSMALQVDVIVENFRPGTMEALGLGYESLADQNPGLIYASITGFGSTGPYSSRPGFDQIAQGCSGLMSVTGTPESGPVRVGVAIGDQTAGMWGAIGILGALAARERTGRGQRIETSLLSSLVGLLSVQGQRYLSLGEVPALAGNTHPVISPYGVFQTADGPLNVAPGTTEMWRSLCVVLDLEHLLDDPRFVDNASRVKWRDELKLLIEQRMSTRSRQEWTSALLAAGIPAGPINTIKDVFEDPQVVHEGLVEEVQHPELGPLKQVGSAIRLGNRAGGVIRRPPPTLGQHTCEVLEEFGYARTTIEAWVNDGLLQQDATVERDAANA